MVTTGATEDAPARRVIAGQKPACIAGRGTWRTSIDTAELSKLQGDDKPEAGTVSRKETPASCSPATVALTRAGESTAPAAWLIV